MTRLLVTRPEPDVFDTVDRLAALGIEGVAQPLLERITLPTSLPPADGFAALALTSANALRALEERGQLSDYLALPVFAVGGRTAAAARAAGFADVRDGGGTLDRLAGGLAAAGLAGPVFYPAAKQQSGDLAAALAPHGIMAVTAKVYEMRPIESLPPAVSAALGDGGFAGALFYSRRTADTFVRLTENLAPAARGKLGVLCLSEQVAGPLVAARFVRVGLADHPSEEAMMALALSFVRDQNTA
jgi:uroporphyrinogen-III synthase